MRTCNRATVSPLEGSQRNHARWLAHKLKHLLAGLVNRHPYLWYAAWGVIQHVNLFLPHEKSYYGFRHLAKKDGGLFLDIGANNGLSARGIRHLLPHYRIFSIEANDLHRKSLENLKRKYRDFDYLIAAAGAINSHATLHMATYKGMRLHTGASVNLEYLKQTTAAAFPKWVADRLSYVSQKINIIKLDDLALAPDLVKTDVEGHDLEALQGLKATIINHRPSILIEFQANIESELRKFCDELDYDIYLYDDLNDRFRSLDAAVQTHTFHQVGASPVNVFLLPSEKIGGLPLAPC